MVAKNWSSLLIEVTISRRLFVVMPENGIFCEFGFSNGILWEFSHLILLRPSPAKYRCTNSLQIKKLADIGNPYQILKITHSNAVHLNN